MTTKADFGEQEWSAVADGPALAGMIVMTAERGGTLRETFALAKAYTDARQAQGASELLDAIASKGPGRVRFDSVDELREHGLGQLELAANALRRKATPQELAEYRAFVLDVAQRVAKAHSEGEDAVSAREQQALDDIAAVLDRPDAGSS